MANYVSKGYTTPAGVNSREAVRQWQQMLGVTADGIWGKNTEAAYRQWQSGSSGWNMGNGSSKSGKRAAGTTLSTGTGSSKSKATAQQKNTSASGGWEERLRNAVSKLTGGKTAADPLPAPKWNSAGLGVSGIGAQLATEKTTAKQNTATKKTVPAPQYQWNSAGLGVGGIGAQLAAARGTAQQNTAPKKTYPLSEYEYPMHGTGAGGIGGQMNADKIAAAAEEKKQRHSSTLQTRIPLRQKAAITAHWAAFRRVCLSARNLSRWNIPEVWGASAITSSRRRIHSRT